jgi:hypothetical protein
MGYDQPKGHPLDIFLHIWYAQRMVQLIVKIIQFEAVKLGIIIISYKIIVIPVISIIQKSKSS